MAYIETLYMRAQLKKEIAELRKLKQELKDAKERIDSIVTDTGKPFILLPISKGKDN